jgi:hypothetical protein
MVAHAAGAAASANRPPLGMRPQTACAMHLRTSGMIVVMERAAAPVAQQPTRGRLRINSITFRDAGKPQSGAEVLSLLGILIGAGCHRGSYSQIRL